jgi:hypothetical protein
MKLLSISVDPKTVKGQKLGYKTAILYLAPGLLSGVEMCKGRSRECFKNCLYFAGRGRMAMVQDARIKRTKLLHEQPTRFKEQLHKELDSFFAHCFNNSWTPVCRLNGTADWDWECELHKTKTVFEWFPKIQFYDYTKKLDKMIAFLKGEMPSNYDLTFSLNEDNMHQAEYVLKYGGRVAVVFREKLPDKYLGFRVLDGDAHDLRFTEPMNAVVGLLAKGRAKKTKAVDQFVKESI